MAVTHHYELNVRWTGDAGPGTSDYRGYRRDNEILGAGKPVILGSSDPAFRGDAARWNPEELLVASLSQCHMLWYLHLCAVGGVVVTDYADTPTGTMTMDATGGGGEFTEVVLRPAVTVADSSMTAKAQALHGEIGALCYIARSVSFPVRHEPTVRADQDRPDVRFRERRREPDPAAPGEQPVQVVVKPEEPALPHTAATS